jgi:branched-chain amino acid transport system permease protein
MNCFRRTVTGVLIAALLLLYPFLVPSQYFTTLATQILIFSIFTMGLNLLLGYTGMASLGHGALFGAGAYVPALLAKYVTNNIWLGMAGGLVAALLLSIIFALIAVRISGVYFIFITLALGQVVWALVFGWKSLTGGDEGITGVGNPVVWSSFSLSGGTPYYYFALLLFVLVSFAAHRFIRSPFGHSMVGIRENESRMRALGFNVWLYKFTAFIVSGGVSGLAGILWAYYTGFVNPRDASFERSTEAVLMVILGGSGTFLGPLVGTTLIMIIKNIVAIYTKRWLFVLGLAYIFIILFASKGIMGALKGRLRGWMGQT